MLQMYLNFVLVFFGFFWGFFFLMVNTNFEFLLLPLVLFL